MRRTRNAAAPIEPNDVHGNYGEGSALRRKQCQELANFELPKEIDWSMFSFLDFESLASKPRSLRTPKAETMIRQLVEQNATQDGLGRLLSFDYVIAECAHWSRTNRT
jgi:hypothetical protein